MSYGVLAGRPHTGEARRHTQGEGQNGTMAKRTLWRRIYYRFWWWVVRFILVLFYRVRIHDERYVPMAGGVLLLANHQSHMDPPAIGSVVRRPLNFVARKTLFKWPLSWHFDMLDAIPLDQEGVSLSGIKETLKRLRDGEGAVIFPEGTRSWDGEMQPLMPGFCIIARRCRVPIVPVGIAGAHEAWPRGTPFPKLSGSVHIQFGPPLLPAESAKYNDEQLLAEVDRRIRQCYAQARAKRRRSLAALG
jgi:1-acyl-sn-glycerol-3-phosphate acyltransferase